MHPNIPSAPTPLTPAGVGGRHTLTYAPQGFDVNTAYRRLLTPVWDLGTQGKASVTIIDTNPSPNGLDNLDYNEVVYRRPTDAVSLIKAVEYARTGFSGIRHSLTIITNLPAALDLLAEADNPEAALNVFNRRISARTWGGSEVDSVLLHMGEYPVPGGHPRAAALTQIEGAVTRQRPADRVYLGKAPESVDLQRAVAEQFGDIDLPGDRETGRVVTPEGVHWTFTIPDC